MDQVGRYQILDELGRGAHGVVYKALDPTIGRTIAIKSIELRGVAEEDRGRVRDAILREARLAGTLSHPNIVTVYDVQDTGTSANIFMEFVDGKSLEWVIASTKAKRLDGLNREGFISLLKQLGGALDYAHRKGIVHRDIKPANILLVAQDGGALVAKIVDFGVAKFASPEATQSLTGTPNYMSPEQVQGAPASGASDQFSLAVIAYELLCGRKAFAADTIEGLLYTIKNEREEPVDAVNPALSQTVRKVMQCALAKNPEQRFATCSEFGGALEFALGDSPSWTPGNIGIHTRRSDKPVVLFEPAEPEEERTWARKLAMIVALCIAVALAILLIVRMNSGPAPQTQVLDTKNAPVSPPPSVEELKYDRHTAPPQLNLDRADNAPAVAKSPLPPAPVSKGPLRTKQTAAVAETPSSAAHSEVQLLSDPPGANVVVDGTRSCSTPCSVALAGGRHTLAATMDGFGIRRKIFHVPQDTSLFVSMARSQGVLLVSSEPTGAKVDVDGKMAGTTPVTLRLTPGSHRVGVWDGQRWHEESVVVSADEVHTRVFRF